MDFKINILKAEEENLLSPEITQDISEQVQQNDQPVSSNLEIKVNIISESLAQNQQNQEEPIKQEKNTQQFDITLLTPAYDPFKVEQVRGRAPMKRPSKLISQSFINNENEINQNQEIESQNQLPDLPQFPRQRSCLKQSGKFTRSAKKKMSRSFFARPLKQFSENNDEQNQLLVENANLDSLKSSFKVNFNREVRVERVEKDELRQKIVKNSKASQFAAEQQKVNKPRSRQPSVADALGAGSSDDKVCFCFIF